MRKTREKIPSWFGCAGSSENVDGSGSIFLDGDLTFEKTIPHRWHSTAASCSNPHFGQAEVAGLWYGEGGNGIPATLCRNDVKRKTFYEFVDRARVGRPLLPSLSTLPPIASGVVQGFIHTPQASRPYTLAPIQMRHATTVAKTDSRFLRFRPRLLRRSASNGVACLMNWMRVINGTAPLNLIRYSHGIHSDTPFGDQHGD